jgi:capsular exopolysaccharide synthesis family protein
MEDVSPLSLGQLWRALRQRWFLATFVTAVAMAGITLYVFSLPPKYTARSVVLLAPLTDELSDPQTGRNAVTTDPFFIRSETAIIGSEGLSRAVVERLELAAQPEFAVADSGSNGAAHPWLSNSEVVFDDVLRAYEERLGVFNDGRSKTVEISFTAGNPRLAAAIANAHAEAYLEEQAGRRRGGDQKSLAWLKQEVDARAKEARDADALVQQYQLENGIVTTREVTMVEQRLSQLSGQLVDARRQLSTQSALLAEIRALRAGADPSDAVNLVANEPLAALLRDRVQAEATLSSLETRLASGHPTLIKQRQVVASLNEVVDKQLARVENEARASVGAAQRQVDDLSRAVNGETSNKETQDKVSAALPALLAEAQVKRTVFETVLNRYQTRLSEHGFSEPTAAIVSRAMPPAKASFPRTPLFLAVGAFVALLCGIAAALIMQMLRPRSMSLNAVADAIGVRPLVAIPRFRNESRQKGVVKIRDPRMYIECIRSMRHAIFEQQSARDTRVCLFTSVVPSQGKTLVAMSLARALARSGTRTLFLEMDLRCPAASPLAHLPETSRGIGAVLEGRAQFTEVLQHDETTGLEMLLAEKNAAFALDRVTVASFSALIGKLRKFYDAIIVDSPPVGVVSDGLTLASVADQTVIVSRNGESTLPDLLEGTRLLRERGATLAGLVLTDVDPRDLALAGKRMDRYVVGMPARLALVKQAG